jgi:hypothetical protein
MSEFIVNVKYNKIPRLSVRDKKRFSRSFVVHSNGCWNWKGPQNCKKYGTFFYSGKRYSAHRVSYLLRHGKIDPRLCIDHLCRNRLCINPDHLELVTIIENIRRGECLGTINAKKKFCSRGHAFKGENLVIYIRASGRRLRQCLACTRIRSQIISEKLKSERNEKQPR